MPEARKNSTFAAFEPCERCAARALDPASGPFVTCPECGPSLWIEPAPAGAEETDAIGDAARLLHEGRIVGVKDVDGLRLFTRADDADLVARLRRRSHDDATPFAVLVRDLEMAEGLVVLDAAAREVLTSPRRPQLLLPRRADSPLVSEITPGAHEVAVMLPRTALQHLLAADLDAPVSMTVARDDAGALVASNEVARAALMHVADHLLLHDLPLHHVAEDPLVRIECDGPVVLRRSGVFASHLVPLARGGPSLVALGGASPTTLAISRGSDVHLSDSMGDFESGGSRRFDRDAVRQLVDFWGGAPQRVVFDPDAGRETLALLESFDVPAHAVEHHHAHVAAVLAEHGLDRRVLGVSLDGPTPHLHEQLGAAKWLVGDSASMDTVQDWIAYRVPGADVASVDPWRTALGLLYDVLGREVAIRWVEESIGLNDTVRTALSMLESGAGCRRLRSFGRLFDALASIAGEHHRAAWPGEAAVALTTRAGWPPEGPFDLRGTDTMELEESMARLLDSLVCSSACEANRPRKALRGLVGVVAGNVILHAERAGVDTVAAAGGALTDPWVRASLHAVLPARGLELLLNRALPPGDAGLAVGQVWVSLHRTRAESS